MSAWCAVPVVALGLFALPVQHAAAGVAPGSTERLSVTDSGSQATGGGAVTAPAVSGDGRYVAFADNAQLDPAAGQGLDNIYVRDRGTGHTVLLSRGVGGQSADSDSTDPSMSADGRYVAFDTTAHNIPDGDSSAPYYDFVEDVVIVDRDPEGDGRFDKVLPDGSPDYRYTVVGRLDTQSGMRLWANRNPVISADGSTIAWQQNPVDEDADTTVVVAKLGQDPAGGLLPPPESGYVDMTVPHPTDSLVTESFPTLSADGQHVAFTAGNGLFVEDLADRRTVQVDVDAHGNPLPGTASYPALSGDGDMIAFAETTTDSRVIVVDRSTGTETVASLDNSGAPVDGTQPALSTDGRYLAFVTDAPNADDGISPGQLSSQVVERDLVVDAARVAAKLPRLPGELASPSVLADCGSAGTCPGDAVSGTPALDADGGTVAFVSSADDLAQGDTNAMSDAFARQFQPSLQAAPLDFGTVPLGGSATATVTVHQVGFGPVYVGPVTVTGGDFSVFPSQTCQNSVLYETGTCLVSVRFAPRGPGARPGTLSLGVRGWPAPFTVGLSGGVGPPVDGFAASPNPLAFPGPQLALSTSAPQVVTVTNTGTTPFTVSSVRSVAGQGLFAGDYTITHDTCVGGPLPAGGSCQVTVVDVPHGAGSRPGALAFTDDAGGSPQLVGLRATGVTPTLQANPAVVIEGRVTTVVGHGFPAGHQVAVTLANLPGGPALTATTGPHGDFSVAVPVFEHADVGTWQATATATGTGLTATTPLLIVQDTYQPPDFTTRG